MSKHDDYMNARFIKLEDENVVSIEQSLDEVDKMSFEKFGEVIATCELVFAKGSVNERFEKLLRAAAIMYQTLHFQSTQLEALITIDELAQTLLPKGFKNPSAEIHKNIKTAVDFALDIAVNGIESKLSGVIDDNVINFVSTESKAKQ